MKFVFKTVSWLFATSLLVSLMACSESHEPSKSAASEAPKTTGLTLDVYKSPTCGCCEGWIDHLEGEGFKTLIHHPSDLNAIKQQHGISPSVQSCHTAVSNQGYVFEGHIPADLIKRFLDNPPEGAIGLAVPGMPIGSPGMEMGDRYDDYSVMLIGKDGSAEVYQQIKGK